MTSVENKLLLRVQEELARLKHVYPLHLFTNAKFYEQKLDTKWERFIHFRVIPPGTAVLKMVDIATEGLSADFTYIGGVVEDAIKAALSMEEGEDSTPWSNDFS